MQTFTHQSKLFGMMRKIVTVALLFLTILVGQSVSFTPAGQATGYSKYNLAVSNTSGLDGAGGFSFAGTGFTGEIGYYLKISFDQNNWYSIASGNATTGSIAFGLFSSDVHGVVQIAFSHERIAESGSIPWPGNNGIIYLRASNAAQSVFWPAVGGDEFTLDLSPPEIFVGRSAL